MVKMTVYVFVGVCIHCSVQSDTGDEDQMSTEEFHASLRKTAADIEMLNNLD